MGPLASKSFLQRCQASAWLRVLSSLTCALLVGPLAVQAVPIPSDKPATYPSWWFEHGVVRPLDANNLTPLWAHGDYPTPDDFTAANVGQLKQIATAAYDELKTWLPDGAGAPVENLVKSWFQLDPATGDFLLDAQGHRQAKVTAGTDNYAAVNLGQVKAVAQPFYDSLITVHYQVAYPWANGSADDYALANLCQIKSLFSFGPDRDTDGDGIPDWWENLYSLDPHDPTDASQISQAGGMSNSDKYNKGLDPTTADTDHDGVPDVDDIDPLDPDLRLPRVPETSYAVIEVNALNPNDPFKGASCITYSLQILDNVGADGQYARLWKPGANGAAGGFQTIAHTRVGASNRWMTCLSNYGQVATAVDNPGPDEYLIDVWSPSGSLTFSYENEAVLGYPITENYPTAWRISSSGYILGSAWGMGATPDSDNHDIERLVAYTCGFAINAATGEASVIGDNILLYQDSEGNITPPSGGDNFVPYDINESGFAVGGAIDQANYQYSMLPENAALRAALFYYTTEYLSADPGSYAYSINNIEQPMAVGRAGPSANKAVMWVYSEASSDYKQKDLGVYNSATNTRAPVFGGATKINDRCEIIGTFQVGNQNFSFWQNGRPVDLNTRISGGYQINSAVDINNNGVILASATRLSDSLGVMVLLWPIVVNDIQNPARPKAIENLPPQRADESSNNYIQRQLSDSCIAYIDPHAGTGNSPEMPHLVANLLNAVSGIKVKWRLRVEYKRGNGYQADYVQNFTQPEDTVSIPTSASGSNPAFTAEMDGDQEWQIFQTQDWQDEIANGGFFWRNC